jgi:hypothetical protein
MSQFPAITSVPFVNPIQEKVNFKTLIANYDDSGEEQRKAKVLFPKRDIHLSFKHISKGEAATLYQFYIDRKGSYGKFAFFYPATVQNTPFSYVEEYVGTGDGTTTIFSLPGKSISNYIVYVDSVAQEETTDYTITPLGGPDGEDKITFVAAPDSGDYITIDFTGYLKIICRFKVDNMNFKTFFDRLVTTGLELKGLLNDA